MRRLLSLLILLIVLIFPLFAGRVRSASTVCAIHVDVEQKMLTLFCGNEIAARYPIATGARDTPTPLGVFRINRRFSGEMGGFGTCFLGLNVPWGDYGIHGTNRPESIGTNASHGCIRMRVADAEALYARVPNGTVVVIECGAYGELGGSLRTLKNGDRSSMVRAVQRKLRQQHRQFIPDALRKAGREKIACFIPIHGIPPIQTASALISGTAPNLPARSLKG